MRIADHAFRLAYEWRSTGIDLNEDFHRLSSDKVETILADAKSLGYRQPKNANGSRARYFFYAVKRARKANA
tara:strand:+ start:1183 stop:1398 length:216 start_codon:yes stop_codon:yes gene_type:complete